MNTYFNYRDNDIQEEYKTHLKLCQQFFSSPWKYISNWWSSKRSCKINRFSEKQNGSTRVPEYSKQL